MAKTMRKGAMAAVAVVIFGMPELSSAADADALIPVTPVPHVRSSNPALVALMRQGTERSKTFRGLVDTINDSDSIVFVNKGRCGRGVRACFVHITFTNPTRYMFVFVDTRQTDSELMGSIAHELRHTTEIIGEPNIRSDAAKFFFYEQAGRRDDSGRHETTAAVDAGNAVRAEIRRSTSRMPSQ